MFGLSFGELCVLMIVAVVVIGPKDMPRVLRKAGQLAGRLRRMASDMRTQSGIDEVLRADGLHEDIAEIRKLAQADFLNPVARQAPRMSSTLDDVEPAVAREKEYPREGPDSYGAIPDTAFFYAAAPSVSSPLARDPLYVTGDPAGVLPAAAVAPSPASPSSTRPPAAAGDVVADAPSAPGAGELA